jgi:N-acetylneuraminate synthase/N,N'-diacetyllegionaminate synthase
MNDRMCIDGRAIGPGCPTFVIAEIGVNHDGSAERAIELVSMAAACGADAVKLQLFRADRLMHRSAAFAQYQRLRVIDDSAVDMLRRYELPDDGLAEVVAAARGHGLVPLATPFSSEDVELVDRLGLPAVKIASPDLVNRLLLSRVARLGKPMLLSTGAATMDEVWRTTGWLGMWGAAFALLHCVSSYPVGAEQANLCWIGELARFGVPVGYSDHTTLVSAGGLAAAAGAVILEKHITYDRAADGPDHAASADLRQFREYVALVRQADALRGAPGKRVLDIERDVRSVSRQSLVLRRALARGDKITEDDLTTQRPGKGIPAAMVRDVLGRRAVLPLAAGTMLHWEMLSAAPGMVVTHVLSDAA